MFHIINFIGQSSGTALWTPANTTTEGWWDASDLGTITKISGRATGWFDKSGNGRDFGQLLSAQRPETEVDTINSLNVLTFNGVERLLNTVDASVLVPINTDIEVFYIVKQDASADDYIIYAKDGAIGLESGGVYNGNNSPGNDILEVYSALESDNTTVSSLQDSISQAEYNSSATLTPTNTGLVTAEWLRAGATEEATGAINASTETSTGGTTASDNVATTIVVGGHGSTTSILSRLLDGQLGELIITHGATTGDKQNIEGYLAWKWGIQGSLDGGHPYKSSPPTV